MVDILDKLIDNQRYSTEKIHLIIQKYQLKILKNKSFWINLGKNIFLYKNKELTKK